MSQFTRPERNAEIRGKIRRRRVRSRFLHMLGGTQVFRVLFRLFRRSVLAWIVLIGMAAFVMFATGSRYFHLKKIDIERNEVFLDIEKVKTSLESFYGRNLIFLQREELIDHLMTEFPDFRSVRVRERWPHTVVLTLELSPPALRLFNVETANFSVISADGVILYDQIEADLPILKVSQYEDILKIRERFLAADIIERIFQSVALAEDLKLAVVEQYYLSDAWELHLILENETAIWVDLQADISDQFRKLELAADTIGLYRKSFEHIDLRIPKQLFWK